MAPSDWLSPLHVGVTRKQELNFSEIQKEVTKRRHKQLCIKAIVKSKACVRVHHVCLSHAAARSTMIDISRVPSSARVEMASRSHSLMSVTTWSTRTREQRGLLSLYSEAVWTITHNTETNLVVPAPASVQLPRRLTDQLLKERAINGR